MTVLILARDAMLFNYRKLLTTSSGLEFLVLHTNNREYLCLQGDASFKDRLKRAYVSAERIKLSDPDNALLPISCNVKKGKANAVFEGNCGGILRDLLKSVPTIMQYAQGKKVGRSLRAFHAQPLSTNQLKRAELRQKKFLERLATYLSTMPRFAHEQVVIEAISKNFGNYGCFRPTMRYGQMRHDRICVRADFSVVLLPSCSSGPGDVCEDFALMETMSAGMFPTYCAGVLDGYFQGEIPNNFWQSFSMQSALYSLWRCGRTAMASKKAFELMSMESQRIVADFENFKATVPTWYRSKSLQKVKKAVIKSGW